MSESGIIDVRGRPTSLSPFYGGAGATEREERIAWVNRRVGGRDPKHFVRTRGTEAFLAAAGDAGIATSVVLGRQVPAAWISNDRVAELAAESPRFVGIAAVDPSNPETGGVVGAVREVRRAVEQLGLRGVNLDPGMCVEPMLPDDRRLYPVYGQCEALGVPVFLMSGPLAGPTLEYTLPRHFGPIASDFPDLDIVIAHGAYPFVTEAIGLAYKHERVHLSPDIYTFVAGGEAYVTACAGFLREQFLFGTGYPFREMSQSVEDLLALPVPDGAHAAMLRENARRVLRLEP